MSNRSRAHARLLAMQTDLQAAQAKVALLTDELSLATVGRNQAINGVLPYVQAVEAFNAWVREQPADIQASIRRALDICGLLDVKVGFAPEHEPNWFEIRQLQGVT